MTTTEPGCWNCGAAGPVGGLCDDCWSDPSIVVPLPSATQGAHPACSAGAEVSSAHGPAIDADRASHAAPQRAVPRRAPDPTTESAAVPLDPPVEPVTRLGQDPYRTIVAELAAAPYTSSGTEFGDDVCALCGEWQPALDGLADPANHDPTCLWRRAQEAMRP
jgi:hypothetical protein